MKKNNLTNIQRDIVILTLVYIICMAIAIFALGTFLYGMQVMELKGTDFMIHSVMPCGILIVIIIGITIAYFVIKHSLHKNKR